jgi:hypothetical protein
MTGEKKEEKGTCKYPMHDGKPCGRDLYDDEHCIFHSEDIEGKRVEFNEKFWEEFERQKEKEETYDFTRFVFPDDISFVKKTFEKDVYFNSAKFFGEAHFVAVKFYGEANFLAAQFSKFADFQGGRFHGWANFIKTEFSGEVNFTQARFSECTTFDKTEFGGTVYFRATKFSIDRIVWFVKVQFSGEVDFERTHFSGDTHFIGINFSNINECKMIYTKFYNVDGLFEFIEENKKKFKYTNKTKFLPDDFRLILGEPTVARYPVIARQIRDDMYLLEFKKKHLKLHFIWWLFADCGRSFLRWALWSLIFAEVFAIIFGLFYYFNPVSFKSEVISFSWPGISLFYYSIVTFTTLGFGDIVPKIPGLQIIIMIEVILGYIMLGGLISILANKLARRS